MSRSIETCFTGVDSHVRAMLEASLEGRALSWEDAVSLCHVTGRELDALTVVADALRREQAGDTVGYVVNRNVNFTNVCIKTCKFCAFSRLQRSEEGYFLAEEEIVRRAVEAQSFGATEICIQAGLPPKMDGNLYARLCRAIKAVAPKMHIHAFSPEEIKYGSQLLGIPYRAFLEELRDAGLGSLPGTSAEILDDSVRAKIAPGRISTSEWIDVIKTAHSLGIPTTSTIMFGHVETDAERMRHLDLLRSIQHETGGFTEFVPLSFVHHESPMFAKSLVRGLRAGPTGHEVTRLFALSRLMLGATFRNLQVSWVKEGLRSAQALLACGANDLGGTLMNESISTSAGSSFGQVMAPSTLRHTIRDAGKIPVQRDTRYGVVKEFSAVGNAENDDLEPLDSVDDPEAVFGSYASLTRDGRYRFRVLQGPQDKGESPKTQTA